MAAVCSFRQGRVAQIQWFWDRADALRFTEHLAGD
jgi:ketosteroid isomerase-like protein